MTAADTRTAGALRIYRPVLQATGAFGIEDPAPFLDHPLAEWAGGLRKERSIQ